MFFWALHIKPLGNYRCMILAEVATPSGAEGLFIVPLFFLLLFLAVLALLLPYFVWRIRKEAATSNKLMRQLLKAYGQDPEA